MGRTYRRNDIDKGIILFFPHRHGGEGFGQTQFAVFAVDNLHHIRDVLSIEGDGYLGAFDGSGNRFFGVTDIRIVGGDMELAIGELHLDDIVITSPGNQGNALRLW